MAPPTIPFVVVTLKHGIVVSVPFWVLQEAYTGQLDRPELLEALASHLRRKDN